MAKPTAAKSTTKLDYFLKIESEIQKRWSDEKIFEIDPTPDGKRNDPDEKYFGTFPYPYMNGRGHIGHTFSLTKLEVSDQCFVMIFLKFYFRIFSLQWAIFDLKENDVYFHSDFIVPVHR